MTLDAFVGRLDKVKPTRDGYTALCPAHEDNRQSLSVSEKNGKILVNCFADCSMDEIVSAMGLRTRDLFTNKIALIAQSNGNSSVTAAKATRVIEDVYPYTDANGHVLYENVRYRPKDFRQRRPDGRGGYLYDLKGVDRVPYRLPELIAAASIQESEIWLTEGEKDADSLCLLGFTASSFKNWKPDFNQYIKDAHVAIFRDHDSSGKKQANDAAMIIAEATLSVKLIDLFESDPVADKHGKDVSDWIDERRARGLEAAEIAESLASIVEAAEFRPRSEAIREKLPDETDFTSLFRLERANTWMMEASQRPIPKKLFDEFWLEGELCILFADTGKGKSILAVQIGQSIASGTSIEGFEQSAAAQTVLYFDFELSDKQFETRYSRASSNADFNVDHFVFSDNFYRAEIDPDASLPAKFRNFEDYLNFSLEFHLAKTKAKVLIVDNLTYLRQETERAKDALPLMKELKHLKKKFDLSILALAHTPKRDMSKPITVNDLQGSKMLANFADNIFAIGESHRDASIRYLKQIKPRSTELKYGADNVVVCELAKPENFLQFRLRDLGIEQDHLKEITQKDRDGMIKRTHELSSEGKTQREISGILGIAIGTVNKYLRTQKVSATSD